MVALVAAIHEPYSAILTILCFCGISVIWQRFSVPCLPTAEAEANNESKFYAGLFEQTDLKRRAFEMIFRWATEKLSSFLRFKLFHIRAVLSDGPTKVSFARRSAHRHLRRLLF